MRFCVYYFLVPMFCFLLTNCCTSINCCQRNHEAICKELKRQIIFNQASSDKGALTEQGAALPKLLKAYHDEGCD